MLSGVVWGLYIKEVREVGAPNNSEPESLVGFVDPRTRDRRVNA